MLTHVRARSKTLQWPSKDFHSSARSAYIGRYFMETLFIMRQNSRIGSPWKPPEQKRATLPLAFLWFTLMPDHFTFQVTYLVFLSLQAVLWFCFLCCYLNATSFAVCSVHLFKLTKVSESSIRKASAFSECVHVSVPSGVKWVNLLSGLTFRPARCLQCAKDSVLPSPRSHCDRRLSASRGMHFAFNPYTGLSCPLCNMQPNSSCSIMRSRDDLRCVSRELAKRSR